MPDAPYIIVGRSAECDVVLSDPTVSGSHARLSLREGRVHVEDLGSANGTFVGERRVGAADVRPGDAVRFGRESLRWSHPRVRAFLRRGALGDTVEGLTIPGRRFICGACGTRGVMPQGFRGGTLRCGACRAGLQLGRPKPRRGPLVGGAVLAAASLVLVLGWWWSGSGSADPLRRAAERLGLPSVKGGDAVAAGSPQEASIRAHTVPKLIGALDPTHPTTRNNAARIAAGDRGPYRVEQVARLWSHVRERWRYVNDPRGNEYFATASETIENDYAGDCDDFAVLMTAMIGAIGGDARVVMMDGPRGGHAYAEACIRAPRDEVRARLSKHYARKRQQRTVERIHFRYSQNCQVWLNLDWNAGVPGGPYEPEAWAVAIYPDGDTETLGPATAPAEDGEGPDGRMRASSPPR